MTEIAWEDLPPMLQMKYNPNEVIKIIKESETKIQIHLVDKIDRWRHIQSPSYSKWTKDS
jgi:hypothetical protein